jgi:hypothetical protein
MINQYHKELLASALDARQKEITEYQVNIDNFGMAIEKIGDDPDLQEFKTHLKGLLSSSIIEQKKAKIMLSVIQQQLGV